MDNQRLTVKVKTIYDVVCIAPDGTIRWRETFDNLVVTEGRNTLLTRTLVTPPASIAWYVGLKGSGTVAAGDTMASHPGWSELTPYSEATRPQWTAGTVSGGSVDNSASPATFSINASATIAGAFLTSDNTKGGTAGLLYGAGDFAASRSVVSGDTLKVTITCQIT